MEDELIMAKFTADTAHSELEFQVKHMMVTKVKGTFGEWSIDVEADNIEDFTTAEITGKANAATINTKVADRDAHLTSADFFDAEKYPEMTFESTKIEGSGKSFNVTGNLTIKDVTNEVTIPLEYNGQGVSPFGPTVYGFESKFTINREDFGLTWNQTLETGGVLVSKDVKVTLELQLNPAEA